jgi:fructose/tagatose bisphosphate aldolase
MARQRPAASAIVIHDLEHARAALAAAAAFGRPVTLVSAPGAAGYAGAAWFLKVVERAAAEHPTARWEAVLDCADHPGHVLSALRQGAAAVRFTGTKATAAKLAAIAERTGAKVVTGRLMAFDLRGEADPWAACRRRIGGQRRGKTEER